MNIQTNLLPVPSKRRSGQKIGPIKFIVCHDTGNDGSTASGNVSYYKKSADEESASAHAFIDDTGVIWCIPETEKAWHVRYVSPIDNQLYQSEANDDAFGFELCFGSSWTPQRNLLAYNNYVELIASMCDKYKLDPTKQLVAHATLDPSRRTDPLNAFKYIGKTWQQFVSDVNGKITHTPQEQTVCVPVLRSNVGIVSDFLKSLVGIMK